MTDLDLEFSFEQAKRRILEKLRRTNEEWERVWQEAQGNPAAEVQLVQLKLTIQLQEAEALEKLNKLEEKVKATEKEDFPS